MMTRPRRFDAVLFDWDDTLCGAEPHRYAHARDTARRFGVELTMAEVYDAFRRAGDSTTGFWQSFADVLPGMLGIPREHHEDFILAFRERDTYKRFQLFDDVLEMIDHLGEHELRVGIISNNDEVAHHLQNLDVHHRFEIVVAPETFGIAKPEPGIFLRTMEQLGVEPERALYVGDSFDNDVIGARAAGLTPVLIDRFGITLSPDELDGTHRVETLRHLRELLDDLVYGCAASPARANGA